MESLERKRNNCIAIYTRFDVIIREQTRILELFYKGFFPFSSLILHETKDKRIEVCHIFYKYSFNKSNVATEFQYISYVTNVKMLFFIQKLIVAYIENVFVTTRGKKLTKSSKILL